MRIIFETADGLKVLIPYLDGGLTLEEIIAKDVPDGVEYAVVHSVPEDRYFRNAWKLDAGKVSVDMDKARNIHMDQVRKARNAKLASLDLDYIRADEDGKPEEKVKIAKEKRRLRDLPETFDLKKAKTPEQLKALWPEDL